MAEGLGRFGPLVAGVLPEGVVKESEVVLVRGMAHKVEYLGGWRVAVAG